MRAPNFEKSSAALASLPAAPDLKFEREDWSLFRTVEGLQQKAGVAKDKLSRLVLKELADNGLDPGAGVEVGELPGGGYFVDDSGPGIDGTPVEIAALFSIRRPMVSTKLLRLPQRGALGNGLRVVAGAVLASGGSLSVITRDKRIVLRPEHDGSTTVPSVRPAKRPTGTRVEISFGPALPCDARTLNWAQWAIRLARAGQSYTGKSSPHWYDVSQFHELLSASGDRPVRDLIANLDGCTGGKAGEIVASAGVDRALCRGLNTKQVARLLDAQAEIPFVVEAWAKKSDTTGLFVCVNRTPVTGQIGTARDKREINAFGCGLSHTIAQAPKDAQFGIRLNLTTPYMPITSDGKEPNLEPFFNEIASAVAKAVKKAHRPTTTSGNSQKDVVLDNLEAVIAEVSGDGEYRFNARQLFYALRPIIKEARDEELKIGNFTAIITDYEAEHGEIAGMYREPRGSIYHPHRRETITLGTLMVEDYERPEWCFNKVVYIEKEGFGEALKAARWAERHDCMLISSKGFSTRAARDLVDHLAEHDEPVTIFCVHDADAWGTMIYQTFQEATRARRARKIAIVNLGLEPWEAIEMGLEVETVEEGSRGKSVADYVRERGDEDWTDWLQTNRVELNAMTTPQFIAWLDGKMAAYGKLIPPPEVLAADLDKRIEKKVRADITARILREAGFEDQVAARIAAIKKPTAATLAKGVKRLFKTEPGREWRDHVEAEAILKTGSPTLTGRG